jgi:hypothetical protein
MRISARLDNSRSKKLELLAARTHLGTSEILKRAIDALYQQLEVARPAEALQRSGFVASGEGDPALSETYKDDLTVLFAGKPRDPR